MLQHLREKSQGVIAWIILGSLIIMFALWGISSYFTHEKGDQHIAVVNGVKITSREVDVKYRGLRAQMKQQFGPDTVLTTEQQQVLKRQALRALINATAISESIREEGFRLSPLQVTEVLMSIPQFQKNNQFSPALLHRFLARRLMSEEALYTDIASDGVRNQLREGIVSSDFLLPNELQGRIALIKASREIALLTIPLKRMSSLPKVSQNEIVHYYKVHQQDFKVPEKIQVDSIVLTLAPLLEGMKTPSKSVLREYFAKNRATFSTSAAWEASVLSIARGVKKTSAKEFSTIAKAIRKEYANKRGATTVVAHYEKDNRVKLKFTKKLILREKSLGKKFREALVGLKKSNTLSPLVQTVTGFSLLDIHRYTPAVLADFEKMQTSLVDAYKRTKAIKRFNTLSETLTNTSYEYPDSLDEVAKAAGLKVTRSGFFTRAGEKAGYFSKQNVLAVAFSADVLTHRNNSALIQVDKESQMVLRVRAVQPEAVLPLKEVQDKIKQRLMQKAQAAFQVKEARRLSSLISSKTNLDAFAAKYRLTLKPKQWLGRFNNKVDYAILAEAFEMPLPKANSVMTKVVPISKDSFGIVVLYRGKKGSVAQLTKEEQQALRQTMAMGNGMLSYRLILNGMIAKAKIVESKTNAHPRASAVA
jgi:peptidyl-prolyl cis-trans isomerase D